jgi:hypothetical protein
MTMTSDRRIASSPNNGRRSRGPKTAAGKNSSRRNALRHGLCAPALNQPASGVEALARVIAGNDADHSKLAHARIFAEAEFVLLGIQGIKVSIMNSHLTEAALSKTADREDDAARSSQDGDATGNPSSETSSSQVFSLAPTIEVLQQLARLERYEAQAILRRRRAMCALLA